MSGSPKVVTLFEATAETDTTEGRGPKKHLAYCLDKTTAGKLSAGRGVWGGDGAVVEHRAIPMGDGRYLLEQDFGTLVHALSSDEVGELTKLVSRLNSEQRAYLKTLLE